VTGRGLPIVTVLEVDGGSGIVARAMATSADQDDRDEKDAAAPDEEPAEEKGDKPAAAKGGAKAEAVEAKPKAASKAVADEDDEEDDDAEEEEAPPPVKAKGARGPGAARAKRPPVRQGGSLGKSVVLFVVIVVGLGLGFWVLSRGEPSQQAAKPKWKTGEVADVEITLVSTDRQDLACASTDEIAGKHCAFEAVGKPWSKGASSDDKTLLKPYTTVDGVQFTAAGLWSDASLGPGKLPPARFSVKCKYKVDGTLHSVGVRWHDGEQFFPNNEWYAGSVSDCKLVP
jgi:hypothetical protein